jgi:hypothetical protein
MYFVTTNRAGYVMFSMTPSERAAVGLTDQQVVHLLTRATREAEWTVLRSWKVSDLAHTDFMVSLHGVPEPADPAQLAARLPANLPPA